MAMDLMNPDKLNTPFQGMAALPIVRQLGLLVGLAASIALGVYVVMWSQEPGYSVLYSELSDRDANEVTQTLQQSGIKYRINESTGAILVEASQVRKARMQLAGSGISNDANLGFELLEKEEGFGTSQFMQTARYQRALEGELARTINSMAVVRRARVHLALPRQSTFVRKQRKASASVFVDLMAGRDLEKQQVAAILNLVASSVPNLETEQVTVVDQRGRLLSNGDRTHEMMLSTTQFEHTRKVEQEYVRRIENILGPVLGLENMRAQVVAELDFTVTEQTAEMFNPDQPAVRSEQRFEEQARGATQPVGVPGALSNQPPANAQAPEQVRQTAATEEGATAEIPKRTRSRSTTNYELDRTISHTRRAPGSVRRLSVAVVVDNKLGAPKAAASGEEDAGSEAGGLVETPRSDEEIARITGLVKQAVGFNALRGDSVNVVNAPFEKIAELEPLPEPPLWEQPWVMTLGKQILGGLVVLLLLLGVLRPVMRNLATYAEQKKTVQALEHQQMADDQVTLSGEQQRLPRADGYEANLNMAKGMVQQDPKLVAQVIKNWVANG